MRQCHTDQLAGFALGWHLNVPVPARDLEVLSAMNTLLAVTTAGDGIVPAYGRALWNSLGGTSGVIAARIPS